MTPEDENSIFSKIGKIKQNLTEKAFSLRKEKNLYDFGKLL